MLRLSASFGSDVFLIELFNFAICFSTEAEVSFLYIEISFLMDFTCSAYFWYLLNAGIDLSQNCILFEKGTIPNALYSVRAYFDDSAHGVKRLWKEPTAKL